jgi:hypothetical protein
MFTRPRSTICCGPRLPAHVGLAQRIHVALARRVVAVDQVEPVRQHRAPSRRERLVDAQVERAACDVGRAAAAQPAAQAGSLEVDAVPLRRLLLGRRLVGEIQRRGVVLLRMDAGDGGNGDECDEGDEGLHGHSGLKRGR